MFLIQELIWMAIGVALAALRQIVFFSSGGSTPRAVAIGAIAAWGGGAATLLATREASSTLGVVMAGAVAATALSIDSLRSRRTPTSSRP